MEQDLDSLRKAVFSRRPALQKIYNEFGQKSIFDYVNSWQVSAPVKDSLLLATIKKHATGLYGQEVGNAVLFQLQTYPLISTIDHHGALNHPFFINSNLLFSLNDHLKYLVCLSTSSVSMNNSSWPSCLVYHDDKGKFCKLPLLKSARGMDTVFSAAALNKEDLNSFLIRLGNQTGLTPDKKEKFKIFVERQITDEILGMKNFSDQAGAISFGFWQSLFPDAPKVIYLPIEDIVSGILADCLTDNSHLFNFLFTQEQGLVLVKKYFAGLEGSFINPRKGSFLFWGLDDKGRRVHLRLENGKLVGTGTSFNLNAKDLIAGLKERRVYPTTLTCFVVMLFFQITCVGGFNQTTWLGQIKDKFSALLRDECLEGKYLGLAEKIKPVSTDNFAEGSLAFLKSNRAIKATGIDILLEDDPNSYRKYLKLSQSVSLAESIEAELPEIYSVVVPATERI